MTCCLTKARSNGSYHPARLGWEQGRQRSGFERCERLITPPQRSTPPVGRSSSTRLARRASKARSKLEARRQPSLHLRRGCCKALAGVGVERLLWCSCCRSVAEVGENHFSRSAVVRKGNGGCVDSANRSTPHDVELARFGRKRCGATAQARSASARELDPAAMSGCRADGRRSGSNELCCPNRRRGVAALASAECAQPDSRRACSTGYGIRRTRNRYCLRQRASEAKVFGGALSAEGRGG